MIDIKTKIKEIITDNFKPKDVGIGIINGIFSNEDVDKLADELVKKLNIVDVSKAKAELLDCKTCIWSKGEALEAPCRACFGRKKHVAIK